MRSLDPRCLSRTHANHDRRAQQVKAQFQLLGGMHAHHMLSADSWGHPLRIHSKNDHLEVGTVLRECSRNAVTHPRLLST